MGVVTIKLLHTDMIIAALHVPSEELDGLSILPI